MARGLVRWLASLVAVILFSLTAASFPFAVEQQVRLRIDQNGNMYITQLQENVGFLSVSLRQVQKLYTQWYRTGALEKDLDKTWLAWRRTARILIPGLALGLAAGTALGMLGALWRRAREPVVGGSILLFAWPDFALILVLQTGFMLAGQALGQPLVRVGGTQAFALPVISLALFPAALAARASAEALERVMRLPFVRTALAKGLSPAQVILRHGLRHVVGQMLADMPSLATITLSNLVMVEVLLGYPGLASQAWRSIERWPGNLELVPAGVALAVTWYLIDSLVRWLRALLLPYLARPAEENGL